jgi:hypothetical protein
VRKSYIELLVDTGVLKRGSYVQLLFNSSDKEFKHVDGIYKSISGTLFIDINNIWYDSCYIAEIQGIPPLPPFNLN